MAEATPHTGSLWFACGAMTACILMGLAVMPEEVVYLNGKAHEWLAQQYLFRTQQQETQQINTAIREGASQALATPMPRHDRFPSRFPLAGDREIGSGFGWRAHPMTGMPNLHEGLDLTAPAGVPILAAASGQVVKAGWQGGYGMLVEIAHGRSLVTRYAHAQGIHVRSGDWVGQGQMIAEVGSTGHSTGPHLHFEIRLHGQALDPRIFMTKDAGLSLR